MIIFPFDETDLIIWTSTWYFHGYISFSEVFCYVSKNLFPLYPKVKGSQLWQHGDQNIGWETFSHLVYLPDLVSNVIYTLSKKKKKNNHQKKNQTAAAYKSLINKEYLHVSQSRKHLIFEKL